MVDRGEACAQGHAASSPYSQLRDTGPECAWGPEGRSPRSPRSPSRLPGPRPQPGRPPAPRSAAWPGPPRVGKGSWGAYLQAPHAARRAPGKRRAARGGRPRAAPSRRAVPGPRRALPAQATARRAPRSLARGGVPKPRSPTGRGTSATCSCCPGSARVGGPGEIRGG